ncbi:amidohydrolase family protein [Paenibacillus arenilitoris]|uniref:Amidohydrolase family protein n=1 Tax=Paenibacillus arenilitoris TaxID=2772299 RepID=A0A927H6P9_9BACL|nr:amidohydrolase family protein [Paenibacillus arenilitoris]MBD2868789.1 amidohydrolase family protein [Paenibacillus arenilitoris]
MSSIRDYIRDLRVIDGHEHLATQRLREKDKTDLFGLMHYLDSDMITAGMPRGILAKQSGLDNEQKAALFMKYWEKVKNTAYARTFKTAMEDLYGMRDWTAQGLLELNEKVLAASLNKDWYGKVMTEKAKIDLAFTLIYTTNVNFDMFRPIMFMDFTFRLRSLKDIAAVERASEHEVNALQQYLTAVDALLNKYVKEGMVATKLGHAYWRTLACEKPTFHEAELVFNRLMTCSLDEGLSQAETRPLQDYLIHFVIQRSTAYKLPIQIHTGHHETSVSGNGNIITNSKVSSLLPLLLEYSKTKFVLLHCGFPYGGEYLTIAKNFENVYADFTWMYIISPTAAKHILHQMIEMVPQTKIQGFGGDYNYIEGTYAHLKLAKKIVGDALVEKVEDGALGEAEAIDFAKAIFRNNLIDIYGLDEKPV